MAANKIILTFDVEEFDMPLEYQQNISIDEQMHIGKLGLDAIEPVIKHHNIPCTLFTTANFAQTFPSSIAKLAHTNEIASHTFFHSSFNAGDLLSSKQTLEKISEQAITGLRMPRMRPVEMKDILAAGYQYDSSINPTYLPGRYNHLNLPRNKYIQEGVLRFPVSVTPNCRIPLFWLSFKNFPYPIFKTLAMQTLKKDGYLSLYFHPWEFTDIRHIKIPNFTKRHSGKVLLNRLNQLIVDLKKEADFCNMHSFLQNELISNK
jgi:peptidoglycan/xylan/chitin deacetylase (PgdA/CDA1 family)